MEGLSVMHVSTFQNDLELTLGKKARQERSNRSQWKTTVSGKKTSTVQNGVGIEGEVGYPK